MSNVGNFNQLLSENRIGEAIAFCESMIKAHPKYSYYHFWLDKLKRENILPTNVIESKDVSSEIENISRAQHRAARHALEIKDLTSSIKGQFKRAIYQFKDRKILANNEAALLEEKHRLVSGFPYSGDIYLPTDKIPLSDQLKGLQNVSDLVSRRNRAVSKSRFQSLKELIQKTGKKRVFILGNGPSIKCTDLNLLKDEITIGFNGIFLHDTFTPTIYVVEDHLVAEDRIREIEAFHCPVKIFPSYLGYCIPVQENTIFLNHLSRKSYPVDTDFSDDAGEISYTGGTVTYTGLQIAASLGFDEIYLIGVDASYKVENVERSTDYGTGVLCSRSGDVNHFDPRYFGKGYRWHDPNVHTMLQAYRKARNYAQLKGITIANATIGGQLEVFRRVNYYDLFPRQDIYPKTAILDFTHIDRLCATGIVKKNLFEGWSKHSLFSVHGQHPDYIAAYQTVINDCYAAGADKTSICASLRSLIEYDPDVLYLRPTHDRPALSMMQLTMAAVLDKPFVVHYMDDWLAKVELLQGEAVADVYYRFMSFLFCKANKVLTISQKMADYLKSKFDVPAQRLQVIHNYIQDATVPIINEAKTGKIIRYFGGMEPDMSLASIEIVAAVVEKINHSSSVVVKFEIYTGNNYLSANSETFKKYPHTSIYQQVDDYSMYLALLKSSDLNVLCYNFDERSEIYLRYSMANKLPEILGANTPFLALGSKEIGTISYLLEERYPFVSCQESDIAGMVNLILFDAKAASDDYFEALNRLQEEFSAGSNQHAFQQTLRMVSNESACEFNQKDIEEAQYINSMLFEQLADRKEKYTSTDYLQVLLNLSVAEMKELRDKIKNHGINWQFKHKQKEVEQILYKDLSLKGLNSGDKMTVLAFWLVSMEHEYFIKICNKIRSLFG